ncbi:DUF5677 domain-containing protein [uncultured Desulfosarcina sp.]|uniref:DUF5677 domain-containing protein n=1 Tax=uncultured Desulfosarcina sp. TaxID=218289 RepID=UPI0029C90E14|nr:DUF5677 domain-containing protein [uncultured Desulfosarcina sp.]
MTKKPIIIGFQEEWKKFLHHHPLWPEKYKLLTSTLTKIFIREVATNCPADRVVFYLGRLCVEDLNEIFILCGNGYGIGGLKILRGLYERVVTLGYIADNPDQAEPFLEYHHIHKGKMINHAGRIFNLEKDIDAEELATAKENYKKFKDKFQIDDCKKCGTKKMMFTWSKLDTASMAKKIGLEGLYFPGFFYPTLQTHATPTSLMARMRVRENGNVTFNEGAQHEWASKSLITAHNLMIYVLMIQNTYFKLNIESEIEERKNDFQEMWSDIEQG